MVLSWAKKWVKDKRKVPFLKFYLCLETRYTVLSIITYFSAIATLIAVGVIDYTTHQSLAMSFMAGYTIDAAVNKDVEPDA
ncbi:hypothetical protein [Methylobacillus sp.]|uniref:hypothetical protein n=1 Tax=Methylobacillus sp. TaxID=56818 RepID=UPI0012C11870|nr:hypothetical protein [Methylobacillus sp.]MPS48559.1 hypothetical protein [Methylobacillus sp.]